MKCSILAFLAVVGLALAGPAPAFAGDRVVVLKTKGDRSRAMEKALKAIVKAEHALVSDKALKRAAKRAKVRTFTPRDIAKVAKTVEASAVIESEVSKNGRAYVVVVRVRKPDGEIADELTQDLKRRTPSRTEKRTLSKRVLAALNSLDVTAGEGVAAGEGEGNGDGKAAPEDIAARDTSSEVAAAGGTAADGSPAGSPPQKVANAAGGGGGGSNGSDPTAADGKRAGGGTGTEVASLDGTAKDDENPLPAKDAKAPAVAVQVKATSRRSHPAALRLEVGGNAIARTLSFNSRAGFDQAPQGYDSALVPGGRAAVEAYPLELVIPGSFFAGIGVAGEFDQQIGLTTRTSDAMATALETTSRRWNVGGRFRYAFGGRATSPSIAIGAGYGVRQFVVDRSPLQEGAVLDLPDVEYKYVDPGLWLRLPLGSRFAISAGARALLFLDAGAIQETAEYGAAELTGVDAEAGLELLITRNILVHVSGAYTRIGYDFVGNGTQTNNRDGDPVSQDIGGAADQYLGGSATIGVMF